MNWKMAAMLMVGALALGTGMAYADSATYPTRFTEFKHERSSDKNTFSGLIDSTKGSCLKGRRIEVIRKHSGNQTTVGKDTTNGNGKFKIALPSSEVKNGTYYAKAKQKKFNDGDKCLEGQSGTVKVSS
jgi:5-hydroxyisourate hydrolase-like protein (transthyretin family)